MEKVIVNNGREDSRFDIPKVEEKRNARYVGQFCLKDINGNWANHVADVFWQETPPNPEYSNYFALFVRNGTVYVTSGASAVEGELVAVQAEDGEIIYSRYRHDFRQSKDGTVWIDGGRDYTRTGSPTFSLKIIDGEFYRV